MRAQSLILAAAWLLSGLVYADSSQHPHAQRGPDMDRLALLLDLDDQQKAQVQKVLEEQHQQMHSAMEQERASGQKPSRDEMRARRGQLQKETLDKLTPILNEQQLRKFQALTEHPPGYRGRHQGDEGGQTQQAPTQH